jgi:hypothetical protein
MKNNILILYPKEFNSYSKFSRKITRITQKLDIFNIYYYNDFNNFISKFIEDSNISIKSYKTNNLKEISHAIIFDDGEEFTKEQYYCKNNNIPIRLINILITRVINIKNDLSFDKNNPKYEYIGRGSYWGNPYSLLDNNFDDITRENVINQFKYDFENDAFINKKKSEVFKLAGKRLACFCKPEACHGDILADFLNSLDDGK